MYFCCWGTKKASQITFQNLKSFTYQIISIKPQWIRYPQLLVGPSWIFWGLLWAGSFFKADFHPKIPHIWLNSPPNQLIHWQNSSRNSQLLYAENAGAPKNKKNEKNIFLKVSKSTHISCINFIILKVNHHKYYIILFLL